jgi:hypothetical protein
MNLLRRIVVGIAGVVIVALALELVAPKAVHAVVATLVQVENTSANPVSVTNGTDVAEQPFATSICKDTASGAICAAAATEVGVSATPPATFTVPTTDSAGNTVKMLVIKFVSGTCGGPESTPTLLTTVPANAVNGITTAANFLIIGISPTTSGQNGEVNVDEATTIVAGPGSTVSMFANLAPGNGCWLTVNGYLAH